MLRFRLRNRFEERFKIVVGKALKLILVITMEISKSTTTDEDIALSGRKMCRVYDMYAEKREETQKLNRP